MSSKKPFIVSRLNFVEEFLDEDIDCLMASPDDLKDWIFKIKKLLSDEILCKKLSDNSYQKYLTYYTWEIRAENLLNIINMSKNCFKKTSLLVLPKGKNWSKELIEAKKIWNFKVKLAKNNKILDKSGGVTLLINEVKKNK